MKKVFQRIITILLAQFISAIGFTIVMLPNNLAPTGLGGLATTINKVTGLNIQLFMLILAIPVLFWAIFKYDKVQVIYASISYFAFTFYSAFVGRLIPDFYTDTFITSLVAGILIGTATGLILRLGIPNGPEAIVANYLREKRDITPGNFFLIFNTIVILSSLIYGDLTIIIYSLFSNFICSYVTDKVVIGNSHYYDVSIITDNIFEITDYIRTKINRSVTFIHCMDTENVKKKMMIKTVVSKQELAQIKIYIKELNDGSFVYVSESAGLIGSNLEMKK